jgi:ribosomal protein S18 acetylase RimI-like enzyme
MGWDANPAPFVTAGDGAGRALALLLWCLPVRCRLRARAGGLSLKVEIRPMRDGDVEQIVDLSLRAWEPVFASIKATVGPRLFDYFYGSEWRTHQADDVRRACGAYEVSVADDGGRVVGFTAVDLPPESVEGEIYMVAVDPDAQGAGIGTQLTRAAIEVIRAAGRRAAVVETGGDTGHAAARATYHKTGFTPFPSERFYLLLDPD